MSLVMIEPRKFPSFAFALDTTHRPAGPVAIVGLPQQHAQHRSHLRNRQGRGIFFPPVAFPEPKTTRQ